MGSHQQPIALRLALVAADGAPVFLPSAIGEVAVRAESILEVGRPAGTPPGSSIDASH